MTCVLKGRFFALGVVLAGFPIGTKGGLKPADASALISRLKQSAPPPNPNTPLNRMDTTTERLQAANQVRVSLEKLMTTINDDEIELKQLIIGLHAAINMVLAQKEPKEILSMLTAKLGSATSPALPSTPAPGAPAGPQAQAPPPQGIPQAPALPVSPGVQPGH